MRISREHTLFVEDGFHFRLKPGKRAGYKIVSCVFVRNPDYGVVLHRKLR